MKLRASDIARAVGGNLKGDADASCLGVSIDTRTMEKGVLFVAIKGAHFDGHNFLSDAVSKGASVVLVSKEASVPKGVTSIVVKDTVMALCDLASSWRERFAVPCVAITGSNGKSTTKEMTYSLLSTLGPVLKTEGNFNNLIGLPLTVFRWDSSHKAAILEMGMNAPGEIRILAGIARPSVGVITNATAAHLEKLGSVEAVARAKGELFEAMGKDATAVVNDEDPWVLKVAAAHKGNKITFGMKNSSNVRFLNMETNGLDSMEMTVSVFGKELSVKLPVPGTHNVMNALAAIAVAKAVKVDLPSAIERLSDFRPMAMRFERIQLANGVRVVNDSYNANPESMRAAFLTAGAAKRAGRFIAALGDMLELGDSSEELHRQVGREAAKCGVKLLFATGNFAYAVVEGAVSAGMDPKSAAPCSDVKDMEDKLLSAISAGDVVLVKGSRGTRMERVVEGLKNAVGTG